MDPVIGQLVTGLVTAAVSLLVAMGTWQVQMKTSREKQSEELRTLLQQYRDENRDLITSHREDMDKEFNELRDEVTAVNATVQQQVAIVDVKISELSQHVEAHNRMIERTYALETTTAVHTQQIANLEKAINT